MQQRKRTLPTPPTTTPLHKSEPEGMVRGKKKDVHALSLVLLAFISWNPWIIYSLVLFEDTKHLQKL
jgi:hypothetical protein